MMNKTKLLSISVVALLVMNLALMAFLMFGRPSPKHPRGGPPPQKERSGPKGMIIAKLSLDDGQQASYQLLIDAHKKSIKEQQTKIMEDKNHLFSLLKSDDLSQKDNIIAKISLTQAAIENTHFQHFLDLKGLCRPDQIDDFNALTEELAVLFPGPGKKKR